jgi:hypothetical protein
MLLQIKLAVKALVIVRQPPTRKQKVTLAVVPEAHLQHLLLRKHRAVLWTQAVMMLKLLDLMVVKTKVAKVRVILQNCQHVQDNLKLLLLHKQKRKTHALQL